MDQIFFLAKQGTSVAGRLGMGCSMALAAR